MQEQQMFISDYTVQVICIRICETVTSDNSFILHVVRVTHVGT